MQQLYRKFRLLVLATSIACMFIFKASAQTPLPLFDEWESNMTQWGEHWGQHLTNLYPAQGSWNGNSMTYYDGQRVFYQIAEHTGQQDPWYSYAQEAKRVYLNYVAYRINNWSGLDYSIPGYRRFSHGLYMDWLLVNSPDIMESITKIRDNPAFSNPEYWGYDNPNTTWYWSNYSRDVAYALSAHVMAERAEQPRNEVRVPIYTAMALNHIDEWITGRRDNPDTTKHRFAPFMAGLTAEALIDYYEWEVEQGQNPNNTIPDALKQLADYMWTATVFDGPNQDEPMWVSDIGGTGYPYNDQGGTGVGAFRYEDRENPTSAIDGTALLSPELNMLIAPLYAWVFKHYGDVTYIEQGDLIWEGGVALSNVGWNTKIFNQNYRWSFNYIKWRNEGMVLSVAGIEDENKISIYPNPVKDTLVIDYKEQRIDNYKIYNTTGRVVQSDTLIHKNQINIASLTSGVYLLEFTSNRKIITLKFIKE